MSQSWLLRQRKQVLLDLATEAGLPLDEELRKDEIAERLNDHLQKNASTLTGRPALEEYYGKRRATPGRPPRESSLAAAPEAASSAAAVVADSLAAAAGEVKSVVKKPGRRPTKVKQESEDIEPASSPGPIPATIASARSAITAVSSALSPSVLSPSTQLAARTPAPRLSHRRRSEIPGPPSPADIADLAEYESEKFVDGVNKIYQASHISESIQQLRQLCSSVAAVQISFLLLEAFALQRNIMPWKFLLDLPSTPLSPTIPVYYPDLFILLSGFYWSTTLLWSATSIFVPVLFAYFYNLTLRDVKRGNTRVSVVRYTADPLIYNVIKALATWLVYARGVDFGIVDAAVADRVNHAIYGGYPAVLIGSGIGALSALYEAAQKKHL